MPLSKPGTPPQQPARRKSIFARLFSSRPRNRPTTSCRPRPWNVAEATLADADRRHLRELGRKAKALLNSPDDTKLTGCAKLVAALLSAKLHPIVWCRYIATADYLARGLQKLLESSHTDLRVVSITGRMGDDERRAKVEELADEPCRVLIATDCLSEGVNLQHAFNAVLHYDLPWNPNRLEQREGRVDRYGQERQSSKRSATLVPIVPWTAWCSTCC